MKAKWLMIGGVALFVISLGVHYIIKIFTNGDEAVAVSLAIFVSPLLVLGGIAAYLMTRMRKKPPAS